VSEGLRVFLVGGGTGGHLTPALGLAEALEDAGHETFFLLGGREVEQAYVGADRRSAGLGFEPSRLPRPLALLRAMSRARRHAMHWRPQATIALGGAASAAALGVPYAPLILLEGNYVAGRSVRWMQRFAHATLTMYADTAGQVVRGRQVGPLPRRSLATMDAAAARRSLGLHPDRPVLLTLGGSQGAADVNRAAAALLPELRARGWQLLALTGAGRVAEVLDEVEDFDDVDEVPEGVPSDLVVRGHCDAMGAAYAAADFVLSRGGASTLGELWVTRVPGMVLPYPHHKDRQQERNARALEPGLLCRPRFDEEAREQLLACLDDAARRAEMAASLAAAGPADGRAAAVAAVEEIVASAK
jgi:UDP-N-acetylglucosamine--N-acetylmuramyl-(pentapeptide) pyrophosphoryl-undecaprenol N-acetylglucosamine transferase